MRREPQIPKEPLWRGALLLAAFVGLAVGAVVLALVVTYALTY